MCFLCGPVEVCFLCGAERKAISGTLLKIAASYLVESQASSRMGTISSGQVTAWIPFGHIWRNHGVSCLIWFLAGFAFGADDFSWSADKSWSVDHQFCASKKLRGGWLGRLIWESLQLLQWRLVSSWVECRVTECCMFPVYKSLSNHSTWYSYRVLGRC